MRSNPKCGEVCHLPLATSKLLCNVTVREHGSENISCFLTWLVGIVTGYHFYCPTYFCFKCWIRTNVRLNCFGSCWLFGVELKTQRMVDRELLLRPAVPTALSTLLVAGWDVAVFDAWLIGWKKSPTVGPGLWNVLSRSWCFFPTTQNKGKYFFKNFSSISKMLKIIYIYTHTGAYQ